MKIIVDSSTQINIEDGMLLDDISFKAIQNSLNNYSCDEVLELSFFLRSNYVQSSSLLDLVSTKISTQMQEEALKIQRAGLMLQHDKDAKDILEELQYTTSKKADFLRGVFFLKNNQFDDAELYFTRVNYKRGLDMCIILRNDSERMALITDPVALCYKSSKYWPEFKTNGTNQQDFLFITGNSDVFENVGNIDVQIKLIEQEIEKKETSKKEYLAEDFQALLSQLQELVDNENISPQVFYDIAKIYHLTKDYENAIRWYEKTLGLDSKYMPAKFNLCRIKDILFEESYVNTEVYDFNALLSLKKHIFDIDTGFCSGPVRRLCWIVIQARNMDKSVLEALDQVSSFFNPVVIANNKAILLKNEESVSILEDLLKSADSRYKEYILYNLGVLKEDVAVLENCELPQATYFKDYLQKNTETADIRLKAFLTEDENLLNNNDNPFCRILLGNKYLSDFEKRGYVDTEFLENAEAQFLLEPNSPFSINGLGIIAFFRNNISSAISLFNQIIDEYQGAVRNLANCYLALEDHSKALEFFLKAIDIKTYKTDEKVLTYLANKKRDFKAFDLLIARGFEHLKIAKALKLLEQNNVQAVIDMNITDPEIRNKVNEMKEKETERKRKIVEVEEYRKKQSFQ
ncbi:hypothetical protein GINT2_000762 [Glugoides intestinalis]